MFFCVRYNDPLRLSSEEILLFARLGVKVSVRDFLRSCNFLLDQRPNTDGDI